MSSEIPTTAKVYPWVMDEEEAMLLERLVTEDDTPVDNFYSAKHQRLLVETLQSSWEGPGGNRRFLVDANVGIFTTVRKPPLVPDVFLSLDVAVEPRWHEKHNRCYLQQHFGKPPEVVIEIVSNREGGEDSKKLRGYAEMGVAYYAIFDPENHLRQGLLRCYALQEGHYAPLEACWFAGVGLGLTLWYGVYEQIEAEWLRWCDHAGEVIPTGAERAEQRQRTLDVALSDIAWRQRALDMSRADLERERQEKERLQAKLRELGASLNGE
jgi:Uma2 family endonuclease